MSENAQVIREATAAIREAQDTITAAIGGLAARLPDGIVVVACHVGVTELSVLGGQPAYISECKIQTELRAE